MTTSKRIQDSSFEPSRMAPKTIWIDLDNSPHVPFFAPIISALQEHGHSVFVTARDFAQVTKLADLLHLQYQPIGRHYGRHILLKLAGVIIRAGQLASVVRRADPDLAVSHGSRSQLLLSAMMGIPSVLIDDYEHSIDFKGVRPRWLIAPEVIPRGSWPMPEGRILPYPGIKEDVYVPQFTPDPSLLPLLEISEDAILVTLRPPATHAHYHSPESDTLFDAVLNRLVGEHNVVTVILPRTADQEDAIRNRWGKYFTSRQLIIPSQPINGLNLIWLSDLVISGGGTMNREAAALHVPVYSTFRGKTGAIDRYLVTQKRLILIGTVDDVNTQINLSKRRRHPGVYGNTETLTAIVNHLDTVLERQCKDA
ncbi:MAG: DUF354 domain-containing protein [Bryobacterales bacterium]|nr:DUF354 domain-containing protein [Bryobacterales bacterium]